MKFDNRNDILMKKAVLNDNRNIKLNENNIPIVIFHYYISIVNDF